MDPSTIHGNPERSTGILNNELYVGRLVWNRLRYIRDPDTGRRVSRLNPAAEWITSDVPHLRIVPDDLWQKAKVGQANTRKQYDRHDPRRFNRHRRPTYLFSGLTKWDVCGGGYVVYSRERLGCFSARAKGTCSNRLTIARQEVEERVLRALRDQLMRRHHFDQLLATGLDAGNLRERISALCQALEQEDGRSEATEGLRQLVEAIILEPEPEANTPSIRLKGDLAAMLGAAKSTKRPPHTGDLLVSIQLVAGAGFEPATFGL